jgi:hypothetical protein
LWGIPTLDEALLPTLGQERIGYLQEKNGREFLLPIELDPKGRPIPTPLAPCPCPHNLARPLLYWGDGILGVAETTYPHPKGWTFLELYDSTPLHKVTVKHLTRAFREKVYEPPNCQRVWESKLGLGELPWHLIWGRLFHPALTNRDIKASWRIIHRSLRVRTWDDPGATCRLCDANSDRLSHLPHCPILRPLFEILEDDPSPQLIILGLKRDLTPLTGFDSILHSILWKFILIAYTQVDTENRTFDIEWVLISTIRRATVRLEAYAACYKVELERYRSRGETPPPSLLHRYNKHILPAACLTTTGHLRYEQGAKLLHDKAGCYTRYPPTYYSPHYLTELELSHHYPPLYTPTRWSATILQQLLREEEEEREKWRESNKIHATQTRKRLKRSRYH